MEISHASTLIIGFYAATVIGILLMPVVICLSCVFVLLYYSCKKYFGDEDVYKFFIANYQRQRNPDIHLEVTNSRDQLTDDLNHSSPYKRDMQGVTYPRDQLTDSLNHSSPCRRDKQGVTYPRDQLTDNLNQSSPCKRGNQDRFPKSPIFRVEDSEGRHHDNLRFYY